MLVSRDRLSSYVMCVPMKLKDNANVLGALMRINNFYRSHGHKVKRFVFDNEAVFRSVQRSVDYAECVYTPTDLHNKHIERLVRELKEKWRCMRADLPYKLPNFLNFEGMMAAAENINSVPNTQTGPTRTAIEIVTGRKPYAKQFRFGQAGLCHVRRTDGPDERAEWCMFLNSDIFNPKSVRVYVPEYRSVVSRKKFRATEGYPDSWNYEKRPSILPIPREERGLPNDALELGDEEKESTADLIDDEAAEGESVSQVTNENKHPMILRSHAKGNESISATGGQRESDVDLEGTSGTEKGLVGEQLTVPSDRDFYR